jgi:hypothetical protein
VFRLPLVHFILQLLDLLLQLPLVLFRALNIPFELLFQLLATSLEVCEIGLKLFILLLVVVQFLLQARAWS